MDSNDEWVSVIETEESFIRIKSIPDDLRVNYQELFDLHPKERPDVKVPFSSRTTKAKRFEQTYGKKYNFGKISHIPDDMMKIPNIRYLTEFAFPGILFSEIGAVINWYLSGEDCITEHSDNITDLVKKSSVFVYTFISPNGRPRDFLVKNILTREITRITPGDRTLLVMGGNCQKEFKHSIPKRKGDYGSRISVTLRHFK